jgi:benzoate-CoA ligase
MGGLLRSLGVSPGNTVLIVLPDSFSFLACALGCVLCGGVAVLFGNRMLQEDYRDCIEATRPGLVIASPGHPALAAAHEAGVRHLVADDAILAGLLGGVPRIEAYPANRDDVCLMLVTSGTTGHPKVVPHTHGDVFAVTKSTGDFLALEQDDVVLCSAKMSHAYGLFSTMLLTLQAGATAVLDPDKPDAVNTLRLLAGEKVTVLASVPALYCLMLLAKEGELRLEHLRCCYSSGETLPESVHQAWRQATGLEPGMGYGATEAMTFVIGSRPGESVPGTAGRAIPPYEAVVVDEHFRRVQPGVPGHLGLRGPSIMRGYLNAPEWTARAFTPDGLLLTGDMAMEQDGVFTILGRMDDMFKVGGLWVAPARVESVLLSHEAVAQCAVTGGMAGALTLVRAHVVLTSGRTWSSDLEKALRAHAAQRLPEYMVPADIVATSHLPLTASGKVQRYKLRRAATACPSNIPCP